MRFTRAIDMYIADMRAEGRLTSPHTEAAYRHLLYVHAEDVSNRDPAKTGRDDVKRTLSRYPNASTRKQRHAILTSFYDWAVYENLRKYSPAREVRPTRIKPSQRQRLTRAEIVAILDSAEPNRRDRWAVNLMLYAGLRNAELRGLRAIDLSRDGWIHVLGKGNKIRWVPVVPELVPIVDEIRTLIQDPEHYILPGRGWLDPPHNSMMRDKPQAMMSQAGLYKQVIRIAKRAGVAIHVTPHDLRHCYGDAVTRYAGVRAAQTVLGHADISTTVGTYTGAMTMDEIQASMTGFGYRHPAIPTATKEKAQ